MARPLTNSEISVIQGMKNKLDSIPLNTTNSNKGGSVPKEDEVFIVRIYNPSNTSYSATEGYQWVRVKPDKDNVGKYVDFSPYMNGKNLFERTGNTKIFDGTIVTIFLERYGDDGKAFFGFDMPLPNGVGQYKVLQLDNTTPTGKWVVDFVRVHY